MKTYTCTGCGITKELTDENFHKNVASGTGFANRCKPCARRYQRERRERLGRGDGYGALLDIAPSKPDSARCRAFDESCLVDRFKRSRACNESIYKRV